MKSKYIDSAEEFITEEGLNNSSTKMLKSDTILYSIFATLGEVGILKIYFHSLKAVKLFFY